MLDPTGRLGTRATSQFAWVFCGGGAEGDTEAAGGSLTSQKIMKDVYFPFNLFSTHWGPWRKGDSPFASAAAQRSILLGSGRNLEKNLVHLSSETPLLLTFTSLGA